MLRGLLAGALVGIALFFGAHMVGAAIDQDAQQRVIFTKNGVTLDCARHYGGHGSVSYGDCHQVP